LTILLKVPPVMSEFWAFENRPKPEKLEGFCSNSGDICTTGSGKEGDNGLWVLYASDVSGLDCMSIADIDGTEIGEILGTSVWTTIVANASANGTLVLSTDNEEANGAGDLAMNVSTLVCEVDLYSCVVFAD